LNTSFFIVRVHAQHVVIDEQSTGGRALHNTALAVYQRTLARLVGQNAAEALVARTLQHDLNLVAEFGRGLGCLRILGVLLDIERRE